MPASKPAPSSRRTKELEAAARKAKAVPPQLGFEGEAVEVGRRCRCRRRVPQAEGRIQEAERAARQEVGFYAIPAYHGRLGARRETAAEEKVDAIVAEARAEVDARMEEETDVPAGGANDEVISHAPGGDLIYDLNPDDLEREFYAQMAQADLALEAIDADLTVEQLLTAKEDEERTKAEAAAAEAAKAKSEQVVEPASQARSSDTPTASTGVASAPAGGVKRSSSGASAPSSKRRRKPVILGTRDG